jgi:hypothetical protein
MFFCEVCEMKRKLLTSFTMFTAVAACLNAQQFQQQRRATFLGGGGGDRGKCTIEVVVDGAAEVEIRGDSASLRNLAGNPPQWRRFECTGPLPSNPAGFRFAGVDGRGRQSLVRDPRNGGVAVVRLEDSDGGSEGYTFDLFWSGGSDDYRGPGGPPSGGPDRGPGGGYGDRGPGGGYRGGPGRNRGVQACEIAVRDRLRRDGYREIDFARINVDDNPGRNDWVVGTLSASRRGRLEYLDFSCSVNLNNGDVRSVDVRRARR